VIEEGNMASGDTIEQTYAAQHHWTVERVFALLIAGGHRGDEAQHALAELAALETLALVWRQRAQQLMG
jgi:MOSC domain-containing protein YiiM